jgi:hypothetical protein
MPDPKSTISRDAVVASACTFAPMDDALAHERLTGVLELIDEWANLEPRSSVGLKGQVRARVKPANNRGDGQAGIRAQVIEHEDLRYGARGHTFTQARRVSRLSKPSRFWLSVRNWPRLSTPSGLDSRRPSYTQLSGATATVSALCAASTLIVRGFPAGRRRDHVGELVGLD